MLRRAQSLHFPTNQCSKQKRKLSFDTTKKFIEALQRKSTTVIEESDDMEKEIQEFSELKCTCGLFAGDKLQCTCGLIEKYKDNDLEDDPRDTSVDVWTDHQLQRGIQVDSVENITGECTSGFTDTLDSVEANDNNRDRNISYNVGKDTSADNVVYGDERTDGQSDRVSGSNCSVTESVETSPTSPASSDKSSQRNKSKLPVMNKTMDSAASFDIVHDKQEKKQSTKTIIKYKTIDLSHVKSRVQSLTGNERYNKQLGGYSQPQKIKRHNTTEQHDHSEMNITSNESHGIRETLTSRMRFEKKHAAHEIPDCEGESYLTPTQRNEQQIKYMRKMIKELKCEIEEKNKEIETLKNSITKDEMKIFEDKEKEVKEIMAELDTLKSGNAKLRKSYQESVKTINALEGTIRGLKVTMEENQKRSEEIYLEMYRKGQETARFERDEEIERLAAASSKKSDKSGITKNELIEKLNSTEMELAKWQTFRRQESYEMADKPETQADAILKFLKDSFFHYLTDVKDSENHLRAMIRIFSYTDVQKKKIATALASDRKIKS